MGIISGKTILLLSPQPWGIMHVSKHHYAIELAKRGNRVYFVNPPDFNTNKTTIKPILEHPNLYTVTYKPFFSWKIRFHIRWLFDILMKVQVKLLLKKTNEKPDIIWCFDPNSFSDLNWFNAKLNIYHPVDPITRKDQVDVALSAHILFSVSKKILSAFNHIDIPKHFINHALSPEFVKIAESNIQKIKPYKPNNKIKAGYVGNLLRKPIDRELFIKILTQNPDVEFHLWGPSEIKQSNLAGSSDRETALFINHLKELHNVVLRGTKKTGDLARDIQDMDMFFLTYQLIENESDRSNSHKILEYLSTGKVIVSVDIENYRDTGLIEMASPNYDSDLLKLFRTIITNITHYNTTEKMAERIGFALENSMNKQIEKIDNLLFISKPV